MKVLIIIGSWSSVFLGGSACGDCWMAGSSSSPPVIALFAAQSIKASQSKMLPVCSSASCSCCLRSTASSCAFAGHQNLKRTQAGWCVAPSACGLPTPGQMPITSTQWRAKEMDIMRMGVNRCTGGPSRHGNRGHVGSCGHSALFWYQPMARATEIDCRSWQLLFLVPRPWILRADVRKW